MTSLRKLFVFAPCLFLAACSTVTIKRNFDRNADFSSYKTYAWAPASKAEAAADPATDKAIRDAVEKNLAARNITKAVGKKPDFYAVYHVTSAGQKAPLRNYTDWGFGTAYRSGQGFYAGWPGRPTTYAVLDEYKVGALIIDFVEVRRQQLVWRGVASAVVARDPKAKRIDLAVHAMFLGFPPPRQ